MESVERKSRPDIFMAPPWHPVQFFCKSVAARALSSSAANERVALSSNSVSEVIAVRDIVVPILYGIAERVGASIHEWTPNPHKRFTDDTKR